MKGIIHDKVFDLRMIYSPVRLQRGAETFPEISSVSISNIQRT